MAELEFEPKKCQRGKPLRGNTDDCRKPAFSIELLQDNYARHPSPPILRIKFNQHLPMNLYMSAP